MDKIYGRLVLETTTGQNILPSIGGVDARISKANDSIRLQTKADGRSLDLATDAALLAKGGTVTPSSIAFKNEETTEKREENERTSLGAS